VARVSMSASSPWAEGPYRGCRGASAHPRSPGSRWA
jgi:hypothetical protein